MLSCAEEYTSNGRIIAAHGQELHVAPTGQSGLQPVTSELRTPLELIANELSIDVVSDAVNSCNRIGCSSTTESTRGQF